MRQMMKHFLLAIALAFLLAAPSLAHGHGGGSGHRSGGLKGTVATMGTSGFTMSYGSKTLKVLCDANTKFLLKGKKASPENVTEGVRVAVTGGISADSVVHALSVNVLSEHPHKRHKM